MTYSYPTLRSDVGLASSLTSGGVSNGRASSVDKTIKQALSGCPALVLVTLSALHPAFCLCCIQKNIAGYFVRSELFVIFAHRFSYENINISYEENIIFH